VCAKNAKNIYFVKVSKMGVLHPFYIKSEEAHFFRFSVSNPEVCPQSAIIIISK